MYSHMYEKIKQTGAVLLKIIWGLEMLMIMADIIGGAAELFLPGRLEYFGYLNWSWIFQSPVSFWSFILIGDVIAIACICYSYRFFRKGDIGAALLTGLLPLLINNAVVWMHI